MPFTGIWFEHTARESWGRSPEYLRAFVSSTTYPYVHNFIEAEDARLRGRGDPSSVRVDGERYSVYYSIAHDGGQTGLDEQGCRILRWLFESFAVSSSNVVSLRFSEIPIVVHETDPARAAALGNALALLRFLGAAEDQAIARILLHPWDPRRGSPRLAAQDYEKRVIEFLRGGVFYPEDVTLFDVLERHDLRAHRSLSPCCQAQVGFLASLLEWIDDCWPTDEQAAAELTARLRNSLIDEARYWRKHHRAAQPKKQPRYI